MIGSSSMDVTPPRSAVTVDFCALLLYSLFSLVLVDHLKNLLIFCVKKNIFYFTRGLAATALLFIVGCILDPPISLDSDLFSRWTWIFFFVGPGSFFSLDLDLFFCWTWIFFFVGPGSLYFTGSKSSSFVGSGSSSLV